jgi:hypothetical protein
VNASEAVFAGRVLSVSAKQIVENGLTYTYQTVTFEVVSFWKGSGQHQIVVLGGPVECCVCGITFKVGSTWLVYAGTSEDPMAKGQLYAGEACGRTSELSRADADLKVLGKPIFATTPAGMPGTGDVGATHLFVIAGASLLLAGGLVICTSRKKQL